MSRSALESNGLNAVVTQAVITYRSLGSLGLQTMLTSPENFINVLGAFGAAAVSIKPGNNS